MAAKPYRIVVLPGDGVGPEVAEQGIKVLQAVSERYDISFETIEVPCGAKYYREHGVEWPEGAFETCRDESDAILLGAIGWPGVSLPSGDIAGAGIVFGLRFGLDLYANVRPTKLYPNVRHKVHGAFQQVWQPGKVDFTILRENTEGSYTPARGALTRGGTTEVAIDTRIITRKGAERLIRRGFELAMRRNGAPSDGKRRVTCIDKSNVRRGCQLFRQVFDEVASEFPDVERDYAYVDAFTQWMVRSPESYDVCVTTNMLGDIVTDLAAVLQGGMGMAASGNLGDRHAMFEPIHGSAPKHAGKDEANPMATVLAVQMMLDWLAQRKGDAKLRAAAAGVERAVESVLRAGTTLTYDLGGSAPCSKVGDALAAAVRTA